MSNMQNASPKRKRVKRLLKLIKEQVEFYFSDANLNRDKYMKDLVGENGNKYVPLSILLKFNQIHQLEATIRLLQRAINCSDQLELSDDRTKVRRKAENILPLTADNDNCTIFIDYLPDGVNIVWMKELCKKFGNVKHIALPRFKSGSSKGFAFVEFSNNETAQLACAVINSPPDNFFPKIVFQSFKPFLKDVQNVKVKSNFDIINNVDPPLEKPCIKIVSNGDYVIPLNDFQQKEDNSVVGSPNKYLLKNCIGEKNNSINNDDPQSSLVQHILHNSSDINTCNYNHQENNIDLKPSVKSMITCPKISRKRVSDISIENYSINEGPSRKKSNLLIHDKTESIDIEQSSKSIVVKKKIRKRPRKARSKRKLHSIVSKNIELRAMMKSEWLELKKAYLREQRENFGKLKSILQKSFSADPDTSIYIKHHLALKKSAAETYLDVSDDEIETYMPLSKNIGKKRIASTPTYVPGVVASISSLRLKCTITKESTALPDFSFLKSYFSQYGRVAYVDVNKGSAHGFIRFETCETAQRAILEDKQFGLCLLTGVDEEKYWDNLLIARQLKRTRERVRTSGRQKLVMRAENKAKTASTRHIKFNENFQ